MSLPIDANRRQPSKWLEGGSGHFHRACTRYRVARDQSFSEHPAENTAISFLYPHRANHDAEISSGQYNAHAQEVHSRCADNGSGYAEVNDMRKSPYPIKNLAA